MVRDVVSIAFLVGVLVVAPLGATSPYSLITPGGTWDVGLTPTASAPTPRLSIPPEHQRPMGHMAFTAVYELEANWAEVARARLRGQADIVPTVAIRPPGATQQQVNEANARLIDESKPVAAAVGLRAAGFPVSVTGQGARVESVVDGLPAAGVLQRGDLIVAVDGQPVRTTDDLVLDITRHTVGDQLTLDIQRGGQDMTVNLPTAASPSDPAHPVVGVTVSTYMFDVQVPFQVNIASDNVGGPSAGLMFALAILDGVTDGDLTRGYYVAGTGTIAQDGTVGAVGGAAEKALAAEQDGAQVFLVPADNADEAHRWVHSIQIVPVQHFEDAVRALCALPPITDNLASPDSPTPCVSGG
jgi:PDZ domain-containing protein